LSRGRELCLSLSACNSSMLSRTYALPGSL
jgi:hypothetical protein